MGKFIEESALAILIFTLVWVIFSFMGSIIKASGEINSCGKIYSVDYVIYTGLFCEIKSVEEI
tara:strand:+ start:285 stop:473 length:189 start_codon:yes stop_codon:yes gene_type:complete